MASLHSSLAALHQSRRIGADRRDPRVLGTRRIEHGRAGEGTRKLNQGSRDRQRPDSGEKGEKRLERMKSRHASVTSR